jgi:hypothetical protein
MSFAETTTSFATASSAVRATSSANAGTTPDATIKPIAATIAKARIPDMTDQNLSTFVPDDRTRRQI